MRDNHDDNSVIKTSASPTGISRRRMLQGAAGALAAATIPVGRLTGAMPAFQQESPKASSVAATDLTGKLARYMVEARNRALPPSVLLEGKHHILDTLGAMVSGSRLKAGEMAIAYVRAQGGVPEASVISTNIKTSMINAALANAMCAHGDETDDVPAGLASIQRGADQRKTTVPSPSTRPVFWHPKSAAYEGQTPAATLGCRFLGHV
jgi:hypothetical protein